MRPVSVPEAIITRFRTISLERIARVEAGWKTLAQGSGNEDAARAVARDLHTLKGDAGIIGFAEVHTLAHKLEELFALAGQLQYRVSQDFERVVAVALQHVRTLLQSPSGAEGEADLQGFIKQIDDLLRDARAQP